MSRKAFTCRIFLSVLALFSLSSSRTQPTNPIADQKISFSGYRWSVRNTFRKEGPGPNYFKASNVTVDKNGYLHLFIKKDSASGEWSAAEVTADNLSGFGTYEFVVDGPLDRLDKNVVLGLFNYSGNDGFDEMDIEFARWGNDSFPNLNYTIWPAQATVKNASAVKEFSLESNLSTHFFRRTADSVVCSSFNGLVAAPDKLIYSHTFTGSTVSISKLSMPVHMNLWLFDGRPPGDKKAVEIVIRSFTYKSQ